jgi:soluble lytic murein transglycosylase
MLLTCLFSLAAGTDDPSAPQAPPETVLADAARGAVVGNPADAITALQALESAGAPPDVQRQADLLLGILLLRQDRREEAVPRLERASTTYPLLADYALWHLAEAYRGVGQRAAGALALQRLIENHPQSLLVERAGRALPRDFLEAGDPARAEDAAGKYLKTFPQGPGRAEVWTTLAEALLRSDRAEKAEEILRRVWIELPGSPESQRARDILATIPGTKPFQPDELFQRATALYQLGRYDLVVPEMTPFAAPDNPREGQARLALGLSLFRLRQYPQAAAWLEPLRDVAGPDRVEAIFWLARSYARSGDTPRFTKTMTLLVDLAPQSRRAEEGLYLLAQAAADDGDVAQARGYLTRLLKAYPRGAWTDDALWLRGWLAYKGRDLVGAVAAWDRLIAEEQGSPFRIPALYWKGRALEAMKKPGEAVAAYRMILRIGADQNYYWFRARERVGRLSKKAVPSPPSLPAAETGNRSGTESDALRARKARALRAIGLDEDGVEEYSEQIRTRPEDRETLAEACRAFLEVGRYEKALWLAAQILRPLYAQENGKPPVPEFWQCLYPRGYWLIVREDAAQRGLDPYLVTALIREESSFAPRAVSRAGARGLMQLMPQTAEQVARYSNPGLWPASLDLPEVNIRLGTIYLAELIRGNGGVVSLALAAYNGGQQQVQRWRDRYGFADEEEFTEDIPFTETRSYVKRVLGSYQRYSTLYGTMRAESREPRAESQVPSAETQSPRAASREPRAETGEMPDIQQKQGTNHGQ